MSIVVSNKSRKPFSKRVANFTISNRKLLTVLSAVISLLLATGIIRTSFDTSPKAIRISTNCY
jgi:hypothetical protein